MLAEKTILISGGTGLIGRHLSNRLVERGHRVILLSRSAVQQGHIPVSVWDPEQNRIDSDVVASADIIIHLAGTNIGAGRWTPSRKRSILDSRVRSAGLLFNAVKSTGKKPELFISASGVSYYGVVTSEKIFTEEDDAGDDFLAHTCLQWERAASSFESTGTRTVIFRNGLVLARNGGIIKRLYLPFKSWLGVIPGSGNQYLPWIHIYDLCSMYILAIENATMHGTYNAVAPGHVNFSRFSQTYAAAVNRKIVLPRIPSALLRIGLGEKADIILKGSRVSCDKILNTGFRYSFDSLEPALDNIF